jgi:hypothetical protein
MFCRVASIAVLCMLSSFATGQETVRYKSAVVGLTDDAELRARFENGLVAKARANNYDAVTSYDIAPDVQRVDDRRFLEVLALRGVQAVLMLRPAAVGAGSSLESVRNEIPQDLYSDMRKFAREVSSSGADDLIAVVHMAIYTLTEREATLISAGAVWLDEQVENRDQGIERLENLILANVNAARPAIRQRLGLPPLP